MRRSIYKFSEIVWREYPTQKRIELLLMDHVKLSLPQTATLEDLLSDLQFLYNSPDDIRIPNHLSLKNPAHQFILSKGEPHSIQISGEFDTYFLRNCGSYTGLVKTAKILKQPQTIFAELRELRKQNAQNALFGQSSVTNYLIRYYLRLEMSYFTRLNKYDLSRPVNQKDVQQLYEFLRTRNQTLIRQRLKEASESTFATLGRIAYTKEEILALTRKGRIVFQTYRMLAITVAIVHMLGFGYMIFGVDWLGWDIIEPLTFSVSCFYFLIGMRFFSGTRKNPNMQNISDWFLKKSLSAKESAELSLLQARLREDSEVLMACRRNEQLIQHGQIPLEEGSQESQWNMM